jgi:hypothetical protein
MTQQKLFVVAAVATIVAVPIGAVSVLIALHQYSTSPLGSWVSTWVSRETLQLALTLAAVAVAWLALVNAWRVDRRAAAEARERAAYKAEVSAKVGDLETRTWAGINKTLTDVRRPIEDRLSSNEDRLSRIEARLAKIAPTALDFAKATLAGDSYPCRTEGGTIQRFTKSEVDELMMKNADAYYKLAKLNPDLERWREDAL